MKHTSQEIPEGVIIQPSLQGQFSPAADSRDAELTRVHRLLGDRAARPAALVIEGEVGISKFALWAAGLEIGTRGARQGKAGARHWGTALTAAERQVAELGVTGLTNREVAARLFASVRTAEGHPASVHRKLGIRSRTELAARYPTRHDAGDSADSTRAYSS